MSGDDRREGPQSGEAEKDLKRTAKPVPPTDTAQDTPLIKSATESSANGPVRHVGFHEWLDRFVEAAPPLLWSHVTNGWTLVKIIEDGVMRAAKPCPHFGKDLVYLFYGRPAYRDNADEPTRTDPRAPVVILLKPAVEKLVSAIYPFDSGAFHTGRYKTWLAPHMPIDRFSLQADPARARRYVKAFFGTNTAYWRMKPTIPAGNHSFRPVVQILCDLLADTSVISADDRRLVVEMSLDKPIPFTSEFVHTIIVPDTMKDNLDEENFTERTGILSWAYEHCPYKKAIEYQALLEWFAKLVNNDEKAFL
jgi:hypothetical protein